MSEQEYINKIKELDEQINKNDEIIFAHPTKDAEVLVLYELTNALFETKENLIFEFKEKFGRYPM